MKSSIDRNRSQALRGASVHRSADFAREHARLTKIITTSKARWYSPSFEIGDKTMYFD
jgi:hypothetical protein